MKTTRKLLALLLTLILFVGIFAGCGKKPEEEPTTTAPETTEAVITTEAESTTETPAEAPTAAPTEAPTAAPTTTQPAVTVTDYNAIMYATIGLNVRSGPGTSYASIGGYNVNDEVKVTGKCSNGWYRVDYNGKEGYCSGKYLSTSKVTVTQTPTPTPTPAPAQPPATTARNTGYTFSPNLHGPGSSDDKQADWNADAAIAASVANGTYTGSYCKTCGKPLGHGTHGTCLHKRNGGTCQLCGASVGPGACHSCNY